VIRHSDRTRFDVIHIVGLVLVAACLAGLSRDGAVDFAAARLFGDIHGFPLRAAPLLAQAGHTGLRWVALLVWITAALLAIAGARSAALRPWRGPLSFFAITAAVTVLAVAALKAGSAHSCPWDMEAFGGPYRWFPLFGPSAVPAGPGHCWPAAHAAGGFAFIAGYYALRDTHPAAARVALIASLVLGALMSLVQMARGAHFLSHNLWTLWIAWLSSYVSYLLWRRRLPCSTNLSE
jgi:membrane-associated PAP2 superfamily phosphatase